MRSGDSCRIRRNPKAKIEKVGEGRKSWGQSSNKKQIPKRREKL